MFYSPLRYPGGKGKILSFMIDLIKLNKLENIEYVEPYAGGAAVALGLLINGFVNKIHINDSDKAIHAFWYSILNYTELFIKKIISTPVTVEEWRNQKNIYNNIDQYSILEVGFSAFFLNRCNRSGVLKGGLIGGYEQKGNWKIDARFNKQDLIKRIERIALYKDKIKLYNEDTAELLEKNKETFKNCILYLDPPYYEKGYQLYKNHYKPSDHEKISALVKELNCYWVVSYDNVKPIVALYKNIKKRVFNISYSAGKNRSGKEVMFFSKNLKVPKREVC